MFFPYLIEFSSSMISARNAINKKIWAKEMIFKVIKVVKFGK